MCRNRKGLGLLACLTALSLAGCSAPSLVTDTGSGKQQNIEKEDYLRTDLLEDQADQTAKNQYQILTLSKQTYEEEALKQRLGRTYINVPTVNYNLEGVSARFGEYLVGFMDYVEKGDPIATIYTDVDDIGIAEARMKLERLEERYAAAYKTYEEDLQKRDEQLTITYNTYDYKIALVEYEQRKLDWENQKYYYEQDIQAAKDHLNKLTKIGAVYQIPAPQAGYVYLSGRLSPGKELEQGDYICHILDNGDVYVITESQAEQFGYGMEVEFSGREGLTPATVVSGGSKALYGNLDKGVATFLLHFDVDTSQLNQTGLNNLTLSGNLKTIKDVIVIPNQAVTEENGAYFVTVLKEDGSLLRTQFIPGGSNSTGYWVLDGLSEGTKIVYK